MTVHRKGDLIMKIGLLRQMTRCCGAAIAAALIAGVIPAEANEHEGVEYEGVEFRVDVGAHALTFTERSSALGVEIETEMHTKGFAVDGEAAYTFPEIPVRLQLGFTTFQSSTDTEEVRVAGVLTQTQDLDDSFWVLSPALGYVASLNETIKVTPLFGWDWQWINQERDNIFILGVPLGIQVTEKIRGNGPVVGIRLAIDVTDKVQVNGHYSHSFLTHITAENSLAETLGFSEFETDGDIDRVRLGIEYKLSNAVALGLAYQFLQNRRDESPVQTVGLVSAVLPEGVHRFHAGFARLTIRF